MSKQHDQTDDHQRLARLESTRPMSTASGALAPPRRFSTDVMMPSAALVLQRLAGNQATSAAINRSRHLVQRDTVFPGRAPSSGPEFEAEMARPLRYRPQPPPWLHPDGIEFFQRASRGLPRVEMLNFGDPVTIVEPISEARGEPGSEPSGSRRYYATTQEQIIWASPTEIQCFRYYRTPIGDSSAVARSHHDANLVMYRYVELEGMSPYSARGRAMREDAQLGQLVTAMVMVSGAA